MHRSLPWYSWKSHWRSHCTVISTKSEGTILQLAAKCCIFRTGFFCSQYSSIQTHCWSGAGLWGWRVWRWAPASPDLSSPLCKPLLPPPGWSHSHDPTPAPAGACSSALVVVGGYTGDTVVHKGLFKVSTNSAWNAHCYKEARVQTKHWLNAVPVCAVLVYVLIQQ